MNLDNADKKIVRMAEKLEQKMAQVEYARDSRGNVMLKVVEIPYRPEFVRFMDATKPDLAPTMPWVQDDDFPADEMEEVTGELRADEPAPLKSHLWCVDPRVGARYGFDIMDVAMVELPELDYACCHNLTMKVHVRVRSYDRYNVEGEPESKPSPALQLVNELHAAWCRAVGGDIWLSTNRHVKSLLMHGVLASDEPRSGRSTANALVKLVANVTYMDDTMRNIAETLQLNYGPTFADHANKCSPCSLSYERGQCVVGDVLDDLDNNKQR